MELFPEFHVIVVPGLHNSGPGHWQTRWQQRHPEFVRVRQDDWDHPQLPAWSARLDQLRASDPRPALLIAHSYGCLTAAHSIARDSRGVAGVLLVAPADPDKFGVANLLPALPLACPAIMISSADDPWMSAARASQWGRRWGCSVVDGGRLGHINADSGLGDWHDGLDYLQQLAEMAHNSDMAFSA